MLNPKPWIPNPKLWTLNLRPTDHARAMEGEEDPCISFVREGEEANYKQLYQNMVRFCGKPKNPEVKTPKPQTPNP